MQSMVRRHSWRFLNLSKTLPVCTVATICLSGIPAHSQWQKGDVVYIATNPSPVITAGFGTAFIRKALEIEVILDISHAVHSNKANGSLISSGRSANDEQAQEWDWIGGGTPGPLPAVAYSLNVTGSGSGMRGGASAYSSAEIPGYAWRYGSTPPAYNNFSPVGFTCTPTLVAGYTTKVQVIVELSASVNGTCANTSGASANGTATAKASF